MNNDELNRKVAELRGLHQCQCDPNCGFWYPNAGGDQMLLPDYCADPAAWSGLFVALTGEGLVPMLEYDGLGTYVASVGRYGRPADTPGRALALAYIASQEGR